LRFCIPFFRFHLLGLHPVHRTYSVRARSKTVCWPRGLSRACQSIVPHIVIFSIFLDFVVRIFTAALQLGILFTACRNRFTIPIVQTCIDHMAQNSRQIIRVSSASCDHVISLFALLRKFWGALDSYRGNLRKIYACCELYLKFLIRFFNHFVHFDGWKVVPFFYQHPNVVW